MILAYTIGNKKSYDSYLKTNKKPQKLGRCQIEGEYYAGGWCWPTYNEAHEYMKKNKSNMSFEPGIYGILLPNSWEQDTSNDTYDEGRYSLLIDSKLVFVDENGNRKEDK